MYTQEAHIFFWKIKLIAQKLATLGKSYQKHGHILQNVPIFPTCVAKCLYKKVLWKKQQFGISKHKKKFLRNLGKEKFAKKIHRVFKPKTSKF